VRKPTGPVTSLAVIFSLSQRSFGPLALQSCRYGMQSGLACGEGRAETKKVKRADRRTRIEDCFILAFLLYLLPLEKNCV
jgi:hypothetical protein